MYTVTFMGKKSEVTAKVFWSLALPMLALFIAMLGYACLMVYLSATMLADYSGLSAILWGIVMALLLGSVTINDQEKAFLHKYIRNTLSALLVGWTIWYQYAVNGWEPMYVYGICVPLISIGLLKINKLFKENQDGN